MKRKIAKGIRWEPDTRAVQDLDWEHSEEDFSALLLYVRRMLLKHTAKSVTELNALVSDRELRERVRQAAGEYEDRFGSLGFWTYQRLKFFIRRKQREKGGA